ncbi:hypothetical protein A1A1_07372 [Planococcus antarcticus DSM 14505]|uniref:Homeodomain phBC6A51-type domain-containing protein n=2 Tax=Planococcus TaxID=1372 RepID=A0A1C7DFU3_9BACL|nr:hypothetical protein [Planococcus antarcticus]ANU10287.1 hypothetical protein BBH88_08220 [Planococcus antarcticus DSM 14505]EIM07199.1 hypothetical protein A1A1_07372 [Planococcus antarcticus DSM 14505]
MRYMQYKGVVEREYKKSLRKIMYEICVVEGLNASLGAKKLGVAKEIFVFWRNFYRLDKNQQLFDQAVDNIDQMKFLYLNEAKGIDLSRPLQHENEQSLQGLEELVERMVEYYKCKHAESGGLDIDAGKLSLYEFAQELLAEYENGSLLEKIKKEKK